MDTARQRRAKAGSHAPSVLLMIPIPKMIWMSKNTPISSIEKMFELKGVLMAKAKTTGVVKDKR